MVIGSLKPDLAWVPEMKEEFQDNFIGYFDKTTVHGLRYLTERRRPWPEKVLWFVGVSVGLVACIWLMHKTYTRWHETPVIMAMDENQQAVWQVPFPAVTICPMAKIQKQLFDYQKFTHLYNEGDLSKELIDLVTKVQLPCNIPIVRNDSVMDESAIDIIEQHALKQNDVLLIAKHQKGKANFQPIMTEEGLCYSFNMMPGHLFFRNGTFHATRRLKPYLAYNTSVDWHPTNGYNKNSGSRAYPYRGLGPGIEQGLHLLLQTLTKELNSSCQIMRHGFKVFLHSPIEFPVDAKHSVFVPLDSAVHVKVQPREFRTTDKLRNAYSAEQRQCFFPDERYLRFFSFYTQSNCQLECLANRTLKSCGCVMFYMPRMPNTPICGRKNLDCTRRVSGELYETDTKRELGVGENSLDYGDLPCKCLSTCATVWYDSVITQTTIDPQIFPSNNGTDEPKNITMLWIYYTDLQFLPIRRMEVFGTADLLASLGGLMGLCMGISLLSVIELFYWMLVRPCCQRIKQRDPELRSVRKPETRIRMAEAGVQYSRHLDDLTIPRAAADAAV